MNRAMAGLVCVLRVYRCTWYYETKGIAGHNQVNIFHNFSSPLETSFYGYPFTQYSPSWRDGDAAVNHTVEFSVNIEYVSSLWRHDIETLSVLLGICEGKPPVVSHRKGQLYIAFVASHSKLFNS